MKHIQGLDLNTEQHLVEYSELNVSNAQSLQTPHHFSLSSHRLSNQSFTLFGEKQGHISVHTHNTACLCLLPYLHLKESEAEGLNSQDFT